MIQLRSKEERLSYIDGYNNCFNLFCEQLKEKSVNEVIKRMTIVVNLINESIEKGEDDADNS